MLLAAEHLSINFGTRQLLSDVNFYLEEGKKAGVIGINGTGKWLENLILDINFDDYEARNYFDLLLRRSGLFSRLEEMGIQDGATVDIYDLQFEYQR